MLCLQVLFQAQQKKKGYSDINIISYNGRVT